MFRPKSYTVLTVQQQQLSDKLPAPGHQSPSAAEKSSSRGTTPPPDDDGYSGGKCKDVSTYQRLVRARIWLRHMLVACINSEWLGNACLAGVVLVLLLGLWALYAHMLHKVSLLQQSCKCQRYACKLKSPAIHPPSPHRRTRVPALVKHCLPSPLWPRLFKSALSNTIFIHCFVELQLLLLCTL
jgi:hypothetical protein